MNWPNDAMPPPEYDYHQPPQQQRPVQQQQPRPVQQQQRPFQNQPPPQQQPTQQQFQQAQQIVRVASQLTDAQLSELLLSDPAFALSLSRSKALRDRFNDCDYATFTRFLWMAQKKGADPDNNDIYLVPFWTKDGTKYSIVFSYHWYIAKAMASGLVSGPIVTRTEVIDYFRAIDDKFIKTLCSKATVFRKDIDKPFDYYARFPEFCKYNNKDGSPIGQWANKPYLMLEKCAIACVLRLAFPDVFAGMYVADEMTDNPIDDEYLDAGSEANTIDAGAKTLFDLPTAEKTARPVAQATQKFD
jgi:phage recombination protein Bet